MTGYEVNGYATPLHSACELNIIIVSLILQVGNYVLRALETLFHGYAVLAVKPSLHPFLFPLPTVTLLPDPSDYLGEWFQADLHLTRADRQLGSSAP